MQKKSIESLIIDDAERNACLYARELLRASADPRARLPPNLPALDGAGSALFSQGAQLAHSYGPNTTKAIFILDAEASFRNGQLGVRVIEQNSAGVNQSETFRAFGTSSSEWLAGGVLVSEMGVRSAAGKDDVSGTQTSAIIESVPSSLDTLSTADLSNLTSDPGRDYIANVTSKEQSTVTMAWTEHLGTKTGITRPNATSNVIDYTRHLFNDGANTPNGLYPVDELFTTYSGAISDWVAGDSDIIFDTDAMDDSPLNFATYSANLDYSAAFGGTEAGSAVEATAIHFGFIAYDCANNILDSVATEHHVLMIGTGTGAGRFGSTSTNVSLKSSTVPIHRIIMVIRNQTSAIDAPQLRGQSMRITTREQTADIVRRPIHVTIVDGVTPSTTALIDVAAIVSGTVDSSRAFLSSAGATHINIDVGHIKMLLSAMATNVRRARITSEHNVYVSDMQDMLKSTPDAVLMTASFGKLAKRFRKVRERAQYIARESSPYLQAAGAAASATGTPQGAAVGGALTTLGMGADYIGSL